MQQNSPYGQPPQPPQSPGWGGNPSYTGPSGGGPPTGPPGGSPQQTNGKSIAALITGIAGCCVVPVLASVAAIVLGIMAKKEVEQQPERYTPGSKPMAIWGLVLGIVSLVLWALYVILLIVGIVGGFGFLDQAMDEYCRENPDDPDCQDRPAFATTGEPWAHPVSLPLAPPVPIAAG